MTENEAKIFIQNAMEQSRNVLAELMLIMPKVFAAKRKSLGEYYSNLENCKKEIQSCEVAIKALEEIKQYRAIGTPEELQEMKKDLAEALSDWRQYRKIGTLEECRAAVEKQTACNPDRVVKQLEEHFNATNDKGARLAYHHAIEIVKGGGVDG
jgi:hypothetical protein